MVDDVPASAAITIASILAEHAGDPTLALSTILARYNELVGQHATLRAEKDAAQKAAERSAQENQQLWRSFKASGGSPRPPTAQRQNSGGLNAGPPPSTASSPGAPPSGPTRRGMSTTDSSTVLSSLLGSGLSTPVPSRSQDDYPTQLSTPARSRANSPPLTQVGSPHLHSRSESHTSLPKDASIDLRRSSSTDPAADDVERDSPPAASRRTFSEEKAFGFNGLPTSASMPLIPSPEIPDRSSNGSLSRRFLPSIVPVSPLQVSERRRSDSPASSPRPERTSPRFSTSFNVHSSPPSASDTYQLQLPGDARRARTPSNTSSSSLGSLSGSAGSTSAVVDERSGRASFDPLSEIAPVVMSSPEQLFEPPPVGATPVDEPPARGSPALPAPPVHSEPPPHSQKNSTSYRPTPSNPQPAAPVARPTLYAAFFPFTRIRVPSSNIKPKEKGKELVSFIIDVTVTVPPESDPDGLGGQASWRVEKPFSEIVALDSTVRGTKVNKPELKNLGPLPDKALFKDHAPHKSDQRKTILNRYLQTLLAVPLRDRSAVCAFFNSDVITDPPAPPASSGMIEGWLTKRGRNFGGWQTRYYILASGSLSYYETREGQKLGEIPLQNAAIGRQSSRAADTSEDSYMHAFLVRTTTRGTGGDKDQDQDHILCAESDEARDAWVTALTSLQSQPSNVTRTGSASFDREREPSALRSNHSHLHSRERSGSAAATGTGAQTDPVIYATPATPGTGRRTLSADMPASVSLPVGLDAIARGDTGKRTMSAQGQNGELRERSNQLQPPPAGGHRAAGSPSAGGSNGGSKSQHHDRPVSPDSRHRIVASQVSGPMNAAPMPSGYDFKKLERTKKTKSSFWTFSREKATEKPPGPAVPAVAPRPVFGVPLKEAVAVSRIRPGLELPAVVYRCVEYLEANNAESEEGIFRLSGSTNVIRVLKDRFNAEGDVQLLHSAEYYDPHAVAGLLKTFLRDLPVHILTKELHPEFIQVIDLKERKDRVNALGKLVARLPIEEYTLFRFFFAHLCVIAQNAEVSKMNLRNLGIVFSPTLAIPPPLFSLLLSEFDLVFAVEPSTGLSRPIMVKEDVPAASPRGLGPATMEHRSNRNSQMYEATGANQLMEPDATRSKLRDQVEEDDSELESGGSEEARDDETGPLSDDSPNFLAPPFSSGQLSHSSSSGSDSSPHTPTFRGLPPSPRPGATFDQRP